MDTNKIIDLRKVHMEELRRRFISKWPSIGGGTVIIQGMSTLAGRAVKILRSVS